jgi:hypothetical protein
VEMARIILMERKEKRSLYIYGEKDGKEEGDESCKGRSSAFLEF